MRAEMSVLFHRTRTACLVLLASSLPVPIRKILGPQNQLHPVLEPVSIKIKSP
jgi:hypothetical protein